MEIIKEHYKCCSCGSNFFSEETDGASRYFNEKGEPIDAAFCHWCEYTHLSSTGKELKYTGRPICEKCVRYVNTKYLPMSCCPECLKNV